MSNPTEVLTKNLAKLFKWYEKETGLFVECVETDRYNGRRFGMRGEEINNVRITARGRSEVEKS